MARGKKRRGPTPMMEQWQAAKSDHPDALLFFRMGDFYELFGDDAVEAARVLELTLTSRDKDKEKGLPMAGVPHHALQGYLSRLIEMGYRVAVCDQLEDPKTVKGLVKRGVTRVVTPGVVVDDVALEPRRNNYLTAVWPGLNGYGLAYADITTGELRATIAPNLATAISELGRIEPREVLLPPACEPALEAVVRRGKGFASQLSVDDFDPKHALVGSRQRVVLEEVRRALGALGTYLARTRPRGDVVLGALVQYDLADYVVIDDTSFRNLELVATLVGGRRKGSLLALLDRTVTAMGARQLRRWLQRPLRSRELIEQRLEAVAELVDDAMVRDDLRGMLGDIYDIERLGGRIVAGLASPKDLANLRRSIGGLGRLREAMSRLEAPRMRTLADAMDPLQDIHERLAAAIAEDPAQSPAEGQVIREGFDAEVDELVELSRSGKDWMLRYEASERERTAISSLKVRYNRVFGYFIEVTRANLQHVPDDYIRKQTIANGERYFTMELKEYESRVLSAEDRRVRRETTVFESLRSELKTGAARILRTASRVADLDVLCGLADAAHRYGYRRPRLLDASARSLFLTACRHPVVERSELGETAFVPNDIVLDAGTLMLITGPNMAGKSTVMRQVALIVLMAQIGSFVPAEDAEIAIVDRIFTRVGATDDLSRGQSTFMVEMSETAHILRNATDQSLIILDEIGRGTSTFDGVSIAWAVAEYIHDTLGARTMFATHYHELTELARTRENVRNVHVAVREWNEEIVFLRQLRDGGTNRSYGIAVGRLAGLPDAVLGRAREVLAALEQTDVSAPSTGPTPHQLPGASQLGLFQPADPPAAAAGEPSEVELAVARVDVGRTTPLEALKLIDRLQRKLARRG